jgi:hypothetical protein
MAALLVAFRVVLSSTEAVDIIGTNCIMNRFLPNKVKLGHGTENRTAKG